MEKEHKRPVLIIVLSILIITGIGYGKVLWYGFVWDDEILIVQNRCIKEITNLKHLISPTYFYISKKIYYRPVVTITQYLDYAVWNGHPFGFHLTNLLFHVCNAVLVMVVGRHILGGWLVPGLAASMFAAHPALTESVSCISMRDDMLSFFFFATSLLCFMKFYRSYSWGWYALSSLLFVLALLSKLMAATLPLIIIWWFSCSKGGKNRDRPSKPNIRILALLVPWFTFVVGLSLLRYFWFYATSDEAFHREIQSASYLHILWSVGKTVIYYLKLLVYPVNQALYPDFTFAESILQFDAWGTMLISGILILLVYIARSRYPQLAFLGGAIFLSMVPVLNIIPLKVPVAERFVYFPAAFYCMFVCGLCMRVLASLNMKVHILDWKITSTVVLTVLIIVLLSATCLRNRVWKDHGALYADLLEKNCWANLSEGDALLKERDFEKAMEHFQKALELKPGIGIAYAKIGSVYLAQGNIDKAIQNLETAIELDPDNATTYSVLGNAYAAAGDPVKARKILTNGLSIDPTSIDILNNLGNAYLQEGNIEEALHCFEKAIEIDPGRSELFANRGLIFARKNDFESARSDFMKALQIEPTSRTALEGLATIYYLVDKKTEKAIEYFRKLILFHPDHPRRAEIESIIHGSSDHD